MVENSVKTTVEDCYGGSRDLEYVNYMTNMAQTEALWISRLTKRKSIQKANNSREKIRIWSLFYKEYRFLFENTIGTGINMK